ncbi:transcriptional regulator, TetR family [Micromonospora sediminicola]|uniref:Transcriptional regulator, TetR family n=1 Tax=Micromonospora sediminicola TaxID=946078 RepID=A0A1A9B9Y2_9ACTN|nr:TetR/AcrR family transcriptional regulator [Micromonospora sediminicola]SBT65784.1 transcriptional regulator, TetR family [Micromonospora sediminicola]
MTVSGRAKLTARGARTRERIVDVTAALVFAQGAAGTSLDEVMAGAAVSKSQLYHYFADKDDLLRAVIERQTGRILAGQRDALEAIDSMAGLRRWRNLVVATVEAGGPVGGCPLGSLANELADRDEATRAVLGTSFARWEAQLAAGLTKMRVAGRLVSDANPEMLAEVLVAALQGGLLLAKTRRSVRPLARALDVAIAHIGALAPVAEGPRPG